jgi:hypothetical protein
MKLPLAKFKPQLETLEERQVPTCTFIQNNNLLTILGSPQRDIIRIGDDGGGGVSVLCDQMTTPMRFSGITSVSVLARGGNDSVRYDLLGTVNAHHSISVNLGPGRNTFLGFLNGSEIGPQADYRISVLAGPGRLGNAMNVSSGLDPDTTLVSSLSVGLLTFVGTPFNNALTPGGSIDQGGKFTLRLIGSAGPDAINFDYRGFIQGTLDTLSAGAAGRDVIHTRIDVPTGSAGRVRARVLGGLGNDPDLRLNVTQAGSLCIVPNCQLTIDALIDGGAGSDIGTGVFPVVKRDIEGPVRFPPFT